MGSSRRRTWPEGPPRVSATVTCRHSSRLDAPTPSRCLHSADCSPRSPHSTSARQVILHPCSTFRICKQDAQLSPLCQFRADSHFPLSGSPTKPCTDGVLIPVQRQWLYTYLRNTVQHPPPGRRSRAICAASSEPVASTTISRRCPEPRPTAWRFLAAAGVRLD